MQKRHGSAAAYKLYAGLLGKPGAIDGTKALDVAAQAGLKRAEIEEIGNSEPVRAALTAQMRMAANLGLVATPSYVLGNTGILGHPGPRSLAGMVASLRRCDRLACS